MEKTEKIVISKRYGNKENTIVALKHPTAKARLAMELMARWGLVLAEPDGEDSAGRQQLRTCTAAEIVNKACEVAEYAYNEFEKREWLLDIPEIPAESDD